VIVNYSILNLVGFSVPENSTVAGKATNYLRSDTSKNQAFRLGEAMKNHLAGTSSHHVLIPNSFQETHDIVPALNTSPPVLLALKKSAILYGNHTAGPLADIPSRKPDERLAVVRPFLVSWLQRAWENTDSELKAKALQCSSICCDEKSPNWAKKRAQAAAVFEVSSVQEKYHSASVGVAERSIEVELNIEGEEEEESFPFHMVIQMYGEWFDEHCEPVAGGPKPCDKTHEIFPLLEDFPLFLAIRKGAFRRRPKLSLNCYVLSGMLGRSAPPRSVAKHDQLGERFGPEKSGVLKTQIQKLM
jgi:hypothetical protein